MCWPHAPLRLSIVGLPTLSSIVFATALIIGEPAARADRAHVTVGGPFMLSAPDGTTVTDETYRGQWLLVFVVYTSCPDICPTTLNEIAGTLETFACGAARRQPIFITVEPERDTPEAMGKYTEAFDSRIVGKTGSPQQIANVAQEYGAYSAHRESGTGAKDYLVDHSTYICIVDPKGKFVRGLDFDMPWRRIAETLRKLMGAIW